jgi:redox-sensitive bicupin YhaK (pirin superfamily)
MKRRTFNQLGLLGATAGALVSQANAMELPSGFALRAASDRGVAEHGWLSSRHSFSFADYHDPLQMGFSDLRVINEDKVAPGKGFGTHPHKNMEIFTYVLEGSLQHQDSMGNGSIIQPGDVQFMSAGAGVQHSEFNASVVGPVHFLQIWMLPDADGGTPSYQQTHFSADSKRGRLVPVVSKDGARGSLKIRQNASVFAGLFDGKENAIFAMQPGRSVYVHIAQGEVNLNGLDLKAGDGVRVRQTRNLVFSKGKKADVLLFDMQGVGAMSL